MPAVELAIDDVAFGGKGVGRMNGKAVFVPFTIPGERVRATITRDKRRFAEGELDAVLQPSHDRVEPPCPYFGPCGGCRYQHIAYERQLTIKAGQVEALLRRVAKIEPPPMRAIIPSPRQYGYRNRVTVHAQEGVIGYYKRESHDLIDVEHCPIASDEVNSALRELRASRPRDGHYALRAHSEARVFAQTNDDVAAALADLVATMLPERGATLIDAYCGAGFFAKKFAARFDRVIGIEWDRYAVALARDNAAPNEQYIAGNVETELLLQLQHAGRDAVLIVDPPAEGLPEAARRAILDVVAATLVYVSCDPSTLARDLRELVAAFHVQSVTPLDMFPQTAEIEVAVHLTRRD